MFLGCRNNFMVWFAFTLNVIIAVLLLMLKKLLLLGKDSLKFKFSLSGHNRILFWTYANLFKLIQTNLNLFELIHTYLNISEPILSKHTQTFPNQEIFGSTFSQVQQNLNHTSMVSSKQKLAFCSFISVRLERCQKYIWYILV